MNDEKKNLKVGYISGVFDMMHEGHLNVLEKSKEMCDYLLVGVCSDEYSQVKKNKTPVFNEEYRRRLVNALKCVDEAIIVSIAETEDKKLIHKHHKFDIIFSGDDWKGTERYKKAEKEFGELGVEIIYLPYTKGISTTDIRKSLS